MPNFANFDNSTRIVLLCGIAIIIYGIIARFVYAPINIVQSGGAVVCNLVSPIIEVVVLISLILLIVNIVFGATIAMLAYQIEKSKRKRRYAVMIMILSIAVFLANLIFYIWVPMSLSNLAIASGGVHSNSNYAMRYSDCNYTLILNISAKYSAIFVFALASLLSIAKSYSIIKNSK